MDQIPHRDTFAQDNLLTRGQEIMVEVDESGAVPLVLRPGEMSLHHVRLVHGSPPNPSGDRRIGFAIRYVRTRVSSGVRTAPLVRKRRPLPAISSTSRARGKTSIPSSSNCTRSSPSACREILTAAQVSAATARPEGTAASITRRPRPLRRGQGHGRRPPARPALRSEETVADGVRVDLRGRRPGPARVGAPRRPSRRRHEAARPPRRIYARGGRRVSIFVELTSDDIDAALKASWLASPFLARPALRDYDQGVGRRQ